MRKIVETRNVRSVKNAVRSAVTRNEFLTVIADIGSGKTTMYNELKEFWQTDPRRFGVVELKEFKLRGTRISVIMESLIRACDPMIKIPVVVEKKYFMLRDLLPQTGKKIILLVDEAQDLNIATMRDLKKIHEINSRESEHLFSIILFGKTDKRWDWLLAEPELGYRMRHLFFDELTAEEIIEIAEQRFGVIFKDKKIKERFPVLLPRKTPLAIRFAADSIRMHYGIEPEVPVVASSEVLEILPRLTLRYRAKQLKITQQQIVEEAQKQNLKISRQRVSEHFHGKETTVADEVDQITEELINRRFTEGKYKAKKEA